MTEFTQPSLTLVTDRTLYRPRSDKKGDPLSLVEAAIAGGVDIVQLRVRTASPDDLGLYAVALRLRELTAGKALFVMTGDIVLAEKTRADGVLLTERSYKPSEARSFLHGAPAVTTIEGDPSRPQLQSGGVRLVGAFARSVTSASRAERGGADYVQIGPAFDKEAKDSPGGGLTLLRKVKDAVHIPVIAFGGVRTPAEVADCLQAGADGVAVTDAIMQAPDPQSSTLALKSAMIAAWRVLHG